MGRVNGRITVLACWTLGFSNPMEILTEVCYRVIRKVSWTSRGLLTYSHSNRSSAIQTSGLSKAGPLIRVCLCLISLRAFSQRSPAFTRSPIFFFLRKKYFMHTRTSGERFGLCRTPSSLLQERRGLPTETLRWAYATWMAERFWNPRDQITNFFFYNGGNPLDILWISRPRGRWPRYP